MRTLTKRGRFRPVLLRRSVRRPSCQRRAGPGRLALCSMLVALALHTIACVGFARAQPAPCSVTVGSKLFTEAVILGEVAALSADAAGCEARHRRSLGGTRILWNALVSGEIDVYAEYTGTLLQEILAGGVAPEALDDTLRSFGVAGTPPLGFNNTYALGVRRDLAEARDLQRISDLTRHTDLIFGFSNEFMDREDGWPSLQAAYRLPQQNVRGMDHDLAYRGLENGDLHVTDLYSTDAEIQYYDLVALNDDRALFPRYEALFLYRADLETRSPAFVSALRALAGTLDEERIIEMNAAVKIGGRTEPSVASAFLAEQGVRVRSTGAEMAGFWTRLGRTTGEHLRLVSISLLAAILIALPLGIWAARSARAAAVILPVVGAIYTIPSLALLVFMIPLLGIGGPPAMVALFLYSLLPVVRNTHTGLTDIDRRMVESASALGLTSSESLRLVELPMASRSILAGIKTAAVINIGTATLGALIGAGGYGQPILTGIRLDDTALILEGAVPAALMALAAQYLFDLSERFLVPAGLRLK